MVQVAKEISESAVGRVRFSSPASCSVLSPYGPIDVDGETAPGYFRDLNLDQIVESIATGRGEYGLSPYFYHRLESADGVRFRQEVFMDLEEQEPRNLVGEFVLEMRKMRARIELAEKARYKYEKEGWFLAAVNLYCDAVARFADELPRFAPRSRGLRAIGEAFSSYAQSPSFERLNAEADELVGRLSQLRYCVRIRGSRVWVRRYESEPDYSEEVMCTFERFKHGSGKDYRDHLAKKQQMNHVEAKILDQVALLFSDVFGRLDDFCLRHRDYVEPTIGAFDREVQFYLAYLDHIEKFKGSGLRFCYPLVSAQKKDVLAHDTFDLALADKLVSQRAPVVCNDFFLTGPERIFVVSGPNQGGKTTLARTFGQLHHLASLGCPVPGTEAKLLLFDRLYTHFECEEDVIRQRGRLEDDLVRIRDSLGKASANSVIILNEIFTSTTLKDARFLGQKLVERLIELDLLGVYVTFVEELSSLGLTTVSMVSSVAREDPAARTFKVVRKPADGRAYAIAIAEKHGLTYQQLRRRVATGKVTPSGGTRE